MRRTALAVAAMLAIAALASCSTTHSIVSPECPPIDSLRYVRHPLGCGLEMPKDSTP